jgi:hypothetical protein
MKASQLTEGMTVRCNKRVGVVSEIRTRVWFKVESDKGPAVM